MTRDRARLLLAGIRVLTHRLERAPTPEELAELLDLPDSAVRLEASQLAELGAVALVTTAFETHVEARDENAVDGLADREGPAISEDLKAFDAKKREESERMSRLFESGEQDKEQRERHRRMEEDLRARRGRKPPNPFGEE
jgi:hypothetical protein